MEPRFIFHPTSGRLDFLKREAARGDVPAAELLRRMMDFCKKPEVLDQLLPHTSGCIRVD